MRFINISGDSVVNARENPDVVIPYAAVLVLTCVVGTFGNILILVTVLTNQKLRTIGNVFILNLTLTDLAMCVLVKPSALIGLLLGGDIYNSRNLACSVLAVVTVTVNYCSILTIVSIAINRYVHICHSSKYTAVYTPVNTAVICGLIWCLGFLPNLYYMYGGGYYRFDPKLLICLYDRDSTYYFNVVLYTVCLSGNVTVTAAYWKIFRFVRKSSQRLSRPMSESVNLVTTVFLIFIVYTVCWGPFLFIGLIDSHDTAPRAAYIVTVALVMVNSSSDWLVYTCTSRCFREAYKQMFRCDRLQTRRPNNSTEASNCANTAISG